MPKESSSSVRIFYPQFDKEELIRNLNRGIKELARKLPLSLVVLFGSYARGNHTVASDIDVLVIYRGKERKDAFATVKKTLDVPLLQPHVHSEEEYTRLKELIGRMIADGIVLFPQKEAITTRQTKQTKSTK